MTTEQEAMRERSIEEAARAIIEDEDSSDEIDWFKVDPDANCWEER